jgi:hypothetical protein
MLTCVGGRGNDKRRQTRSQPVSTYAEAQPEISSLQIQDPAQYAVAYMWWSHQSLGEWAIAGVLFRQDVSICSLVYGLLAAAGADEDHLWHVYIADQPVGSRRVRKDIRRMQQPRLRYQDPQGVECMFGLDEPMLDASQFPARVLVGEKDQALLHFDYGDDHLFRIQFHPLTGDLLASLAKLPMQETDYVTRDVTAFLCSPRWGQYYWEDDNVCEDD